MELDSSELLKRFVAADVGIGFISRSNVEEDVRAKALTTISIAPDAQVRRETSRSCFAKTRHSAVPRWPSSKSP